MIDHPRPHDLLLVADPIETLDEHTPTWVRPALRDTPWVVVRRGEAPPNHLAVGVRGRVRSHRFAWTVSRDAVRAVTTPEDIAAAIVGRRDGPPALAALPGVRDVLQLLGLPWGPTGSVGFELATGHATVTADSDLDLVVRVADPTTEILHRLTQVRGAFALLPVRVDCQVELPSGSASLNELVSGGTSILLRTRTGPCLADVSGLVR